MKKVTLIYGDITNLSVDALVNSANVSLLGGGGLDYVVHKKGGEIVRNACVELHREKGGCVVGQTEITDGGDLPAQYIIHAVGPRWLNGMKNESQLLCDTYYNSLIKADSVKARTVAFPNISTGVHRFPKEIAAQIAIGVVLSNLSLFEYIEHVFFVCNDSENYEIYEQILLSIEDARLEIYV